MLSPFPVLLSFGLLAPFLIRVLLGIFFVQYGWFKIGKGCGEKIVFFEKAGLRPGNMFVWTFGAVEIVGGIMLILGFYTQVAAIILSLIAFGAVVIKFRKPTILTADMDFYILLFVATLSLLFSGAGAFAFDLPL